MKKHLETAAAMAAGALLLLAVQVAWIFDAFVVRTTDACERRYWDRVYSEIAARGIEE